ncbi:MAG: Type II restriction endonuclease [Parcubacteria group bacterium GW2011_GWB1_43_6]|nr:MAG: Type II restriction endonuclease [Parcubacteria group bacterium GW2011_GWB1_43_6]
MKIKNVKTAIKVGDFVLKQNHRNHIDIKYLPTLNNKVLTDNSARVYLIIQDGVIKKIGGSASKGGIKATMIFYVSAMTGSPGVPRFVAHLLIEKALRSKSKVELYMITSPKTLAKVSGLFGHKKVEIASFKEMEDLCKSDYFSKEGKYPDWNFQENHEPYPPELARKHNLYHQRRLKGR